MEEDPRQWVSYEQQGNIGARIMLNPAIFGEISSELSRQTYEDNLTIVDVGAGTGSLSREFLCGNVEQDRALSFCADGISNARRKISRIINLDNQTHYLEEGRKITSDERISFQVAEAHELPLEDESVDLVVSRQMLMHLSPIKLKQHFGEIYRVLRCNRSYIFTVTNPGVEHLKYVLSKGCTWDSLLQPGTAYHYPHGAVSIPDHIQGWPREILANMIGALPTGEGTTHFLAQYFHTPDCYLAAARSAHLFRERMDDLYAVIPGFEKTHVRYYPPALPNSMLFKFRKPLWSVAK